VFRINRRTDYSIRVMLSMAKRPFGERLSTSTVQDEMLIPRSFLQRIIADLSRAGLLATYPGPNGGLQLSRPAEQITLRHIWEAIEGELLISDCLQSPGECPLDCNCPVRLRWGRLQSLIVHELERTTLAELASEASSQTLSSIEASMQNTFAPAFYNTSS
jgi:Rrf2 family iron-sulfur cluster assembly transcriptional regulator